MSSIHLSNILPLALHFCLVLPPRLFSFLPSIFSVFFSSRYLPVHSLLSPSFPWRPPCFFAARFSLKLLKQHHRQTHTHMLSPQTHTTHTLKVKSSTSWEPSTFSTKKTECQFAFHHDSRFGPLLREVTHLVFKR